MRTGNEMALIRVFEIEVLNFGSSKTSITHSSKPIYLLVKMGTHTIDFFHNVGQKKLNVSFNLKEHFFQDMRQVDDEFGNRGVEVNIPIYPNSIFPTLKPGDEFKMGSNSCLDEDEDEDDYENDYEDEYTKPCPNCEDMYLEKYETCEFCGYTRYK